MKAPAIKVVLGDSEMLGQLLHLSASFSHLNRPDFPRHLKSLTLRVPRKQSTLSRRIQGRGGQAGWDEATAAVQRSEYAAAVKEIRSLSEAGDAKAQATLGSLYALGRGVPQDDAEAVKWYRKAAEQEFADAQNNLGIMFTKGQGVPRDFAEAAKWYRKAAKQGNANAQNMLGGMYEYGYAVPKDSVNAYALYNLAAAAGISRAASNRDRIATDMSSDEIPQAEALARELAKPGSFAKVLDARIRR